MGPIPLMLIATLSMPTRVRICLRTVINRSAIDTSGALVWRSNNRALAASSGPGNDGRVLSNGLHLLLPLRYLRDPQHQWIPRVALRR